jgi:hypothetical protein
MTSRSVTNAQTSSVLRQLFQDFPSSDPSVRVVLLMTVFTNPDGAHVNFSTIRSRLGPLKLGPLTRTDICNLFINPFLERFNPLLEYLRVEFQNAADEWKGMSSAEIRGLIEEVATRCIELECKAGFPLYLTIPLIPLQGRMLKKLHDGFPTIHDAIVRTVLTRHQINLEDLPPAEDIDACIKFKADLSRCGYWPSTSEQSDYFWDRRSTVRETYRENRLSVELEGEDVPKHDAPFLVRH